MRIALPIVTLLLTAPALAVVVRRWLLFMSERGLSVGGDVVLIAYATALAAFALAVVSAQRYKSTFSKLSLGVATLALGSLCVAHAIGVFVPAW